MPHIPQSESAAMCGPGVCVHVVCAGVSVDVCAMQPGPRCVCDHAAALVPRSLYRRYLLLGLLLPLLFFLNGVEVHTHKTLCLRGQNGVKGQVARVTR